MNAPPGFRWGCSCGLVTLPERDGTLVLDGVEHRYGLRCRPAKSKPNEGEKTE